MSKEDKIPQISKNAIKRLSYVAGSAYISTEAVDLINHLIGGFTDEVVRISQIMMEHSNTKTIKLALLEEMAKNQNTIFLKNSSSRLIDVEKIKACKPLETLPVKKGGSDERLKHIVKYIKKAQSEYGKCYVIPRQTIVRMLRMKMDGDYRISKDALENLTLMIESFVLYVLTGGMRLAQHADRLKMSKEDIKVSLVVKGFPIERFV